jgi:hypothetical protein
MYVGESDFHDRKRNGRISDGLKRNLGFEFESWMACRYVLAVAASAGTGKSNPFTPFVEGLETASRGAACSAGF